jgi:AAHS family 3-hydroxyphenylpropionic acid transporter
VALAASGLDASALRPTGAIVAVCFAIAALEGYDLQTLGVAAPALGQEFHLATPLIGLASSAMMAAMGVGAALGGWLADRIGRRIVLVASIVLFGLASGLTVGVVRDAGMLVLFRTLTGLGVGGAMPNLIAIVSDAHPARRRATAISVVSAGLPAGAAACALLDRLTAGSLDWLILFIVGGLAVLPAAPLVWMLTPGTRTASPVTLERRDVVSQLFGEGRLATTLLLWAGIGLAMFVLSTLTVWLPTLMIHKGLSRADASVVTFIYMSIGVISGLGIGGVIDRVGFAPPLFMAFALIATAMVALSLASGLLPLALAAGLAGLACCSSQFGLYSIFPRYYSEAAQTTGAGAGVAAGRVGSVLGPGVCGLLLGAGTSANQVVEMLIPVAICGGLTIALLTAVKPRADRTPPPP